MSLVNNVYKTFDAAYPVLETCCVFLDMSWALGKVWDKGLIFKLKLAGVSNAVSVIESLLSTRFQREYC